MTRIFLVVGHPGHGKTTLAAKLADEYSYCHLSVDQAYVDFIEHKCHMLYFDALHLYIGPHYESILAERDYSLAHLERDFVAQWRCHLATRILEEASVHKTVVVEGYLLKHCLDAEFQGHLSSSAKVFVIEVRNQQYWRRERLSTSQVAALGME